MDITGASALVTGGASGLGFATAQRLTELGATVTIVDLPSSPGAERAAELGGSFAPADVTDPEAVAAAVQLAVAAGPLRVVVNCAGIATGMKTVSRKKDTGEIKAHDMAQFERTVRVNLFGTFRVLSQSAAGMVTLEPMADGERGLIVNTASVAAQDGQIGQAAYSASKGGVYAMTLPIARDLAQEGVRCNTILPGIMWTPMMAGMDQKIQDALAAAIPFPSRLGTPADYASLVLELARNVYINGECIRLDGAIRLAPR